MCRDFMLKTASWVIVRKKKSKTQMKIVLPRFATKINRASGQEGAEIKRGQKVAFERLCDALQDSGRHSLVMILDYDKYNLDGSIDVASMLITSRHTTSRLSISW